MLITVHFNFDNPILKTHLSNGNIKQQNGCSAEIQILQQIVKFSVLIINSVPLGTNRTTKKVALFSKGKKKQSKNREQRE